MEYQIFPLGPLMEEMVVMLKISLAHVLLHYIEHARVMVSSTLAIKIFRGCNIQLNKKVLSKILSDCYV